MMIYCAVYNTCIVLYTFYFGYLYGVFHSMRFKFRSINFKYKHTQSEMSDEHKFNSKLLSIYHHSQNTTKIKVNVQIFT
jgi:hypothetical protein